MNKTKIEYLDYTWNPYTGCNNWCNGICGGGGQEFNCWAKGLAEGWLKRHYPFGFEPTFYPERLEDPLKRKNPARIGVCFMGDPLGDWLRAKKAAERMGKPISMNKVKQLIFEIIRQCPQHTFLFLTKCPWNLAKWNPWPDNCWVGASATNRMQYLKATRYLDEVDTRTKYISFEPLLERIGASVYRLNSLNWVIIGAATKQYRPPRIEWVTEIEEAANRANIPVFEKDNLAKLLKRPLRQEYPI